MAEREHILVALVEEVLGPRHGPQEILPADQDPRAEYITGVLAPVSAQRPPDDIESEPDDIVEEAGSHDPQEDQDSQGVVVVPGILSPALDPKALPSSIGLSFTLSSPEQAPEIEICATWARYQTHKSGWQRKPEGFLTGRVPADRDNTWTAGQGVSLQMRVIQMSADIWRVSLFMVNTAPMAEPPRPSTGEHLFQPQIRVICSPTTILRPVRHTEPGPDPDGESDSQVSEDESLDLVYRDRSSLARGHLCGAVWRSIDPERPHPDVPSPVKAPFAWTDADTIPTSERGRFTPADVRTEMVPCYPLEAPEMGWEEQFGPLPVLDPAELAETWTSREVRSALAPMVDGYRAWIDAQRSLVPTLPVSQREVAERHITRCEEILTRLGEAIDLLASDQEVRLAFCFANKAIAVQSQWRGQVLTWRPFQLAFILLNVAALANPNHADRNICDLLWFPTGGGKTEAYLGLAAFTIALRRRRSQESGQPDAGNGTGVLSRYTLRLLTIQQFRRALGVITACEYLRVQGLDSSVGPVGWRPSGYGGKETFLWGGGRFSAGLWVGGNVTPNGLLSIGPFPGQGGFTFIPGALDILKGAARDYQGPDHALRNNVRSHNLSISGEPAQVLSCPCCSSVLAVPDEGLLAGSHTLHFLFEGGGAQLPSLTQIQPGGIPLSVDDVTGSGAGSGTRSLSVTFTVSAGEVLTTRQIDEWWYQVIEPALGQNASLLAARPSRPGYFILGYNPTHPCDFDIFCPNPDCELNQHAWAEQTPLARTDQSAGRSGSGPVSHGVPATATTAELPVVQGRQWQNVPEACSLGGAVSLSMRIPIPALTVDDQIYHRCPSLVIATVDKFARLAFEPKAASLFGKVTHYHSRWGYYRESAPPSWEQLPPAYRPHPPGARGRATLRVSVPEFDPPDLILQDELHLIEGPLGSMVGLYETAIEELCHGETGTVPKYVASTATVRQAGPQVRALFNRRLAQFPSWGISAEDRFFAREQHAHPLDSARAGRLYVGICGPGKGAQTPIVRIWSQLLQSVHERWQSGGNVELDRLWTLVGYFNAIRELAGALSLYRQDIPERLAFRSGSSARILEQHLELSGRARSLDLPSMLERLSVAAPSAPDGVFATSMFGTGVDVDRLGLMVVHGQPKTTASYIQATGRVGRASGGLVVTFFRASRPRDLDHYEFFTGYHHALYRYVEPVTVSPFSPRARERALGPLSVVLLRHASEIRGHTVDPDWRVQQRISGGYHSEAGRMSTHRHDLEVEAIADVMEHRAIQQPSGRRPVPGATAAETRSELDRWAALAGLHQGPDHFVYDESTANNPPQRHVVLGDAQHRQQGFAEAYENTPQSLREVEETTGFQT